MFKGRAVGGKFFSLGLALCLFPAQLVVPGYVSNLEEEPPPQPEEIPEEISSLPSDLSAQPTAELSFSESEIPILTENILINQDQDEYPFPVSEDIDLSATTMSTEELLTSDIQEFVVGSSGVGSASFIVKVPLDTNLDDITRSLLDAGLVVSAVIQELGVVVVDGDFEKADELAALFSGDIQYIEEDLNGLSILNAPNDPYLSFQYGLELINAPAGWKYEKGSSRVTIAVLDTGVDLVHQDLAGKLVAGYNFVAGNEIPQDDNGHGTGVAGICAAVTDNGAGIAGVSWGASIMPVKILDSSGNGNFVRAAQGIIWAVDHGAQVINLSLGGYTSSSLLEDAINYAIQKGVVVVAASGNQGIDLITYPARYDGVISVGSVDQDSQRSSFSNYGPELDVVAPGSAIFSLSGLGSYSYISGTSAAAPFASGLVALLLSAKENSYLKIGNQICRSSLDLGAQGRDDQYGCGLIQVDKAIKLTLSIGNPKNPSHHKQTTEVLPNQPLVQTLSKKYMDKDSMNLNGSNFTKSAKKEQIILATSKAMLNREIKSPELLNLAADKEKESKFFPSYLLVFLAAVFVSGYFLKENRSGKDENQEP